MGGGDSSGLRGTGTVVLVQQSCVVETFTVRVIVDNQLRRHTGLSPLSSQTQCGVNELSDELKTFSVVTTSFCFPFTHVTHISCVACKRNKSVFECSSVPPQEQQVPRACSSKPSRGISSSASSLKRSSGFVHNEG